MPKYTTNPETGRKIKIGGPTYKKLNMEQKQSPRLATCGIPHGDGKEYACSPVAYGKTKDYKGTKSPRKALYRRRVVPLAPIVAAPIVASPYTTAPYGYPAIYY